MLTVDPTLAKCDFLRTGDFNTLPMFDGCNELTGLKDRFMRAGIEPGIAAAEDLHVEPARFEISAVYVGDLQLAARGWFHASRNVGGFVVEKI